MYCVECDHFLCQTCLKQHNKFDSMKQHQVVKNASGKGKDDKRRGNWVDLPSQRCDTHHGKLIDMYCRGHNEVCCGACASINHSSCADLLYLPKAAKAADVLEEAKDMLVKMEMVQSNAKDLSNARQLHVANLKAEKVKISDQIKDTCSKIINHFKRLETVLLTQLSDKASDDEDEEQAAISQIAEVISSLKSEHLLLTKFLTDENKSSLFVQLKLAEKCQLQCTDTLISLKTPSASTLEFSVNHLAIDAVNEIKSLGEIIENKTIKSVSLNGDVDVKSPKDKSTCDITDIIMHIDGSYLITDFENKSLKKLDSQYQVVDILPLSGQPNAVCFVSSSSVAVALTDTKTVQFVNLTRRLAMSSSFSVTGHCRGIAHKDGLIYVTCGGNHKFGEGKGFLCVYNYSGNMLKTFDTDMSLPKHILKHKDGLRMYVVDTQKCLLIITSDGRTLKRRIFRDIDNPKGICSGPGSQHFLSGYSSSTIILLSGNAYQVCVINVDDVKRPQALCFDQFKSRLIVAMDNTNTLKVLDVSFE
ncbi:uncharacterized protein LOC123536387 [Mercenaria mercenaria]|uniref:uncharacterized protein LOC123536387 n=1 Tax=Mercenaria mercenaria TaxID=6596 RepID=UPI00234EAB2B|nr:uncharacterized protein LOC123536387 [Mercenaria mercenaria]